MPPLIGSKGNIQRGAPLPRGPQRSVGAAIHSVAKSAPALLNPGPVHVVPSHSSRGVPSHAPVLSAPARVNPGPSPRGVGAALSSMAHSKAYKQAVLHTFLHQPKPQQAAIVKGALRSRSFEGDTILKALRGAGTLTGPMTNPAEAAMAKLQHESGLGTLIGKTPGEIAKLGGQLNLGHAGQTLSNDLGVGERALLGLHTGMGPEGRISQEGLSAGNLGTTLIRAPIDVARATLEDPSVLPKTIKGAGEVAVGGLAGLAQIPYNVVHEGAGKAFSNLFHGMASDYSSRYGPLMQGNDRAFIDRIKKQGAGSELIDALGAAGGLDVSAGRAAADLAKGREALTGRSNFLTRDRPGLRVSGGDIREQKLAHGAMKITAQRLEDKLRATKEAHRPGEIKPNAGQVRPLFGNRSQRILSSTISARYRRVMQEHLNKEVRHGAAKSLVRLSHAEKKAAPVALEGIIPLERGRQAAVDAIDARIASIVKDRAEHPQSPGNHIPAEFASRIDELKTLQDLRGSVDKWLTPRLARFVKQEGARAGRLERAMPDSYLTSHVAEARRLRPQGEMLGVEHPDVLAARLAGAREVASRSGAKGGLALGADLKRARKTVEAKAFAEKFANYEHAHQELRHGLLKDYSEKVRAAAQAKGLPEPAYMPHRDIPAERLGNYTSGTGHRAMPASKRSTFALWRGGAVDRHPNVYTEGIARSIKVGHQWPLVDEQMRRSALPEPSASAIKAAGFGARRADTLTGREYAKAMMFDGHEAKNLTYYNPGRLRQSTLEDRGLAKPFASRAGGAPPELEANPLIHDALANGAVSGAHIDRLKEDDPFVKTTGWKALPPSAYKEIHASLQPSGFGGRAVGKLQGAMGLAILGGSPSFLVMNTLAHMVLATFGTRGRILTDMAKAPLWYHGLTDAQKAIVDSHAGGRGAMGVERLGSTAPHALAASWQKLKDAGIGRFTVGSVASHMNPIGLLFKAEDLQSNHFRRMVYYSATKRAALDSMAKDMSLGVNAMNRLNHVFTLGPKDRMIAQISNLHTAEELGRTVVNMMGDYTRFTNFERKFINNRAVLFYSFMRHATRTLLYVLPFKHPIATALTGELAKLHNDEVKKLLGGADLPYAYSRLYFGTGKNQKLSSIDFARSSPIGSIGTDLPNEGIAGAAKVIPPELQPLLNMIYKHTPSGAPYQQNLWSLLNSFGSLSYPYRLTQDLHDGTKLQQSDSVPFLHERPQVKKTAAAQQYQAAKEAALGPNEQKVLASLFGLYPKPDDIAVVAARQNQLAAAKANKSSGSGSVQGWGKVNFNSGPAGWGRSATSSKPAGW